MPDKQFKVMVIKMLTKLEESWGNTELQQEIETIVKYQIEATELITELKYSILTLKLGSVSHRQSNDTCCPVIKIMIGWKTHHQDWIPTSFSGKPN